MTVEFNKLQFTKDWNNPTDFPTYEENEQKVRADLQALHDETREFINETLIPGIENLAVPGTGDMKTEVYDPEGKRTDMYRYAEDKITEHLEKDNHVDAFSKEESLSAETREALGIAEDAVPDDAFAKIAATPDVVMDESTGKKYTVNAKLDGFGAAESAVFRAALAEVSALGTAGLVVVYRKENYLLVAGASLCVVYNIESGEKLASYETYTIARWAGGYASDGSVCVGMDASGKTILFDFNSLTFTYNATIKNPVIDGDAVYSCWYNSSSADLYLGTKANPTKESIRYNRASNSGGSNYTSGTDYALGVANNKVYFLVQIGNTAFKLSYYDLVGKNLVDKVLTFSGIFGTNSASISVSRISLIPVLKLGSKIYFQLEGAPTSGTTRYICDKLFWIDLETLEHNWGEMSYDRMTLNTDSAAYAVRHEYYMGSIGDNAYFMRDSVVCVWNKPTGDISRYSLATAETMTATGQSGYDEVFFDIPELPGCVISGTYILDTTKGIAQKIRLAGTDLVSEYGVAFGGTVIDTEVVGMNSIDNPIGGGLAFAVDSLKEYAE